MVSVIAHRGASVACAENTVEAFRQALALGADAVELDVRLSADDRLVVMHDAVVERYIVSGHAVVHPWVERLTADHVRRCHDAGLEVNTWTCNEPERMRQLVHEGVDGICTDVPDVLVDVLARQVHQ